MAQKSAGVIEIQKPNVVTIDVPIVGTSPLITHNWDEKNKQQMRDKHAKAAKKPRATKPRATKRRAKKR